MRGPVSTLLLLSLLTFFVGLGRPAISDMDEGYYAEAAREMVESGDWLTPHFNYTDRWQKPVLYYWLTSALYLVTGPSEWSARAASALSGVGLVFLTWVIGRRVSGRDDTAFLAGAIVATCYGYFAIARLALPDLPLTFFITLTVLASLQRQWLLAGLAAGLGFLMKGPVGVVIPAIIVLPIWWREQSWPRASELLAAAGLAAVIGLPWYAVMAATHGRAYLESFFVGDNLERFATSRYNDPRSVLFYIPIVIGGLMPWTMYLLVLPWRRLGRVLRRREHLQDPEWRLVIWTAAPLIFYTLSVGKQPRYVLPVLPPLAILLARAMMVRIAPAAADEAVQGGAGHSRDASARGLAVATWLTALFFLALALLLFRARALYLTAYPAMTVAAVAALVTCGAAVGWVALQRRWRLIPTTLAAASAVALLAVQFGALSGVRPEPVEEIAAAIRANRTTETVGTYQVFGRNLAFYTGVQQSELFDDPQVIDFLRSPEPVLLVARARQLQRLTPELASTLRTLAAVRYVDTANVRLGTLLDPDPLQAIDTVLLVSNR